MTSLLGVSVVFWCKGLGTVLTDVVVLEVVVLVVVVVVGLVLLVVVVVVDIVVELLNVELLISGTLEGVAARSNSQGGSALGVVAGVCTGSQV